MVDFIIALFTVALATGVAAQGFVAFRGRSGNPDGPPTGPALDGIPGYSRADAERAFAAIRATLDRLEKARRKLESHGSGAAFSAVCHKCARIVRDVEHDPKWLPKAGHFLDDYLPNFASIGERFADLVDRDPSPTALEHFTASLARMDRICDAQAKEMVMAEEQALGLDAETLEARSLLDGYKR